MTDDPNLELHARLARSSAAKLRPRSPLDAMIDAVCRCVKYDQAGPVGSCGCWVRLECPLCGKGRWVDRDPSDPAGIARVVYPCLDHPSDPADEAPPRYFNPAGAEIFWSEGA
jgi:hypothetical protein